MVGMLDWLKNIKGVILDISGTLHMNISQPEMPCRQGLKRLQLSVIAVKLVTNSTQKSKLE